MPHPQTRMTPWHYPDSHMLKCKSYTKTSTKHYTLQIWILECHLLSSVSYINTVQCTVYLQTSVCFPESTSHKHSTCHGNTTEWCGYYRKSITSVSAIREKYADTDIMAKTVHHLYASDFSFYPLSHYTIYLHPILEETTQNHDTFPRFIKELDDNT